MSYTALVLHEPQQAKLKQRFGYLMCDPSRKGWRWIGEHMTIGMRTGITLFGVPLAEPFENQLKLRPVERDHGVLDVQVVALAVTDRVIAVGVTTWVPSDNKVKHITLAVAPGAKPKESNDIPEHAWQLIDRAEQVSLCGHIREVK